MNFCLYVDRYDIALSKFTKMKINDKHLNRIAVGNIPIDKEGYLLKKGEVNKSYQKRWFVLKGNLLFYFDKRGEREATGVIVIEGCTVELAEMTDAFTFELVFPGSSTRTYILAASTQEEMESWMKAITCASYDYMKLMVAELQKQVDELNAEEKIKSEKDASVPGKSNGHDLLVDISSSSHSAASIDPFSSPEPCSSFTPSYPDFNGQDKDFEVLHKEYGDYIKQRMREASLAS